MGKKIFITYKYSDSDVLSLNLSTETKARHYVDEIQSFIDQEDHINKGEQDGEDLTHFKDGTIESKLRDKIFDSSITIVLISKNMKEYWINESDQWIPWEISYSLKEHTRDGRTSKSNAILAVVLPDRNGSYEYFLTFDENCNSTTFHTERLFAILRKNMFNIKTSETRECNGKIVYSGYFSYIYSIKWEKFIEDVNKYFDIATTIRDNIDDYNIVKTID